MKTLKLLMLIQFFALTLCAQEASFHPKRIIAVLNPDVEISRTNGQIELHKPEVKRLNELWKLSQINPIVKSKPRSRKNNRPDTDRILLFEFEEEIDVQIVIDAYSKTGYFRVLEPDYIGYGAGVADLTPNDQFYYNRQWSLFNDGTFNGESIADADIDMDEAWDITTGNPETVIAVLDSGFKIDHPELQDRFWNNNAETPGNGTDDDSNGYTDDSMGWDFVNNDNDPSDDHGHGTNVAGIIGATGNNGIGYAGINWEAQLMIGKILNNNNSGFYSNWINAIYYAVDNGADVVNMSVGGSGFSIPMETACNYAHDNDVVIVVCMMNTDSNTSFYPAAYSSTIAVGATDTNDERVSPFFWDTNSGSNYGSHHDVCAPGNYIYGLSYTSDSNYNSYWGGTSQACPIVAGVASLMMGINPELTVEEIRTILRSTAEDQVGKASEDIAGWDQYHGAGRLNALAALEATPMIVNVTGTLSENDWLTLSPNPILQNGNLQLSFKQNLNQQFLATILDSQGKLLQSINVQAQVSPHIISAPAVSGTYYLKIESQNFKTVVYPFIVHSK
jgi:subtilisin family serine protease